MSQIEGSRAIVGTRALIDDECIAVPPLHADAREFSEVLVASNGRFMGEIHILDVVREESAGRHARVQVPRMPDSPTDRRSQGDPRSGSASTKSDRICFPNRKWNGYETSSSKVSMS